MEVGMVVNSVNASSVFLRNWDAPILFRCVQLLMWYWKYKVYRKKRSENCPFSKSCLCPPAIISPSSDTHETDRVFLHLLKKYSYFFIFSKVTLSILIFLVSLYRLSIYGTPLSWGLVSSISDICCTWPDGHMASTGFFSDRLQSLSLSQHPSSRASLQSNILQTSTESATKNEHEPVPTGSHFRKEVELRQYIPTPLLQCRLQHPLTL